jgi:hypothetical protein
MKLSKQLVEFRIILKKFDFFSMILFLFWKVVFKFSMHISKSRFLKFTNSRINQISEWLFIFLHSDKDDINYSYNFLQFNGLKYAMRFGTSDYEVFNQVILQKNYKNLIEFYTRSFGSDAKLIYDLGANVGYSAMYFSNAFKNNCNIRCFEPFDSNIEILKLNTKKFDKIEVFHNAIWKENSFLKFNKEFRDKKEWSISISEGTESDYDVLGLSLAELIIQEIKVDILKIDIEGSEKILFQDKEYALKFLQNVKCICIEIHDEFECREHIFNILTSSNFIFYDCLDLTIGINLNFIKC